MQRKESQATWLIVTVGDRNVVVVPLRCHDSLNVVGNEVLGREAVAHATCAHGDGVTDANDVEVEGHHAGGDAVSHGLEEVEVHVVGVALVL